MNSHCQRPFKVPIQSVNKADTYTLLRFYFCVNLVYTFGVSKDLLSNQAAPLGQLLLVAFRWFDEQLLVMLAKEGWPHLSPSQSLVFAYLDVEGTRLSELARRIGVSRQAVHRTVKELVALDLIELTIDPDNKSAKLVKPTKLGQKNIQAALSTFQRLEQTLGDHIGHADVAKLRAVLEKDWG